MSKDSTKLLLTTKEQTEALAEDEASYENQTQTMMKIPIELLPNIES